MTTKMFFSIVCFICLCSSVEQDGKSISKAEWLIGTWENKTGKGSLYESWQRVSDHEFSGKSFMVSGADTMVFENIRLLQEEGRLYYIPVVKGQNQGAAVRFSNKKITGSEMHFENLQHDFPQQITYTRISADSIVAAISGKGGVGKQLVPMRRIK